MSEVMNREEMEAKAAELKLSYNPRLSDANLLVRIQEAENKKDEPLDTEVMPRAGEKIMVYTTEEYGEYSKANGRTMGRPDGVKTVLSTQELRVLINANWTPTMVKEKHGISDAELTQVVFRLSTEERRDVPIKFGKVVING